MPSKKHYPKPASQVNIAKRRITFLFEEAKEVFRKDSKLSGKYVKMARRIAMKYRIRMPSKIKRKICKHCNKFLVPGANCRVRIHKHRIIYYCFNCKNYMRYPVK